MKAVIATLGLSMIAAAPAAAQSFTYDMEYTNRCYTAATVKDSTNGAFFNCNLALSREAGNGGDRRAASLVNRGILYLVANNLPAAGRDFEQALAVDSTQPEALLGKAIERWQAGDNGEAVTLASQSLQYGPQRPAVAYFVRGLANERLGNVAAAYADLSTARRLEPRWGEPQAQLLRYKVISR